jgi:hypothetical protein
MSSQFGRDVPLPPRLPNGDWSPADIVSLERETEYLDDPSRMKAEYWADGPRSEFPPGHWSVFAQAISRKRGNSLDDDVKLFFALGNALMDASIAAWAWKFKVAAEAGQSRRYGGIHFPSGDLHGCGLGDAVGGDAWTRAQSYIRPFSPGPI